MSDSSKTDNDKAPLLKERPIINYTKRYDQVSWHSADTDFEPGLSSADEIGRKCQKKPGTSLRRKQKIAALVVVVAIFLGVMIGLLYLYVAKSDDYVEISCGKISGISESSIYIYKGIPYAIPPTKSSRWKPPIGVPKGYCGKGIFKARTFKSVCSGVTKGKGSEDCLYLNVYTPVAPNTEDSKKPVIVFFLTDYLGELNGGADVQNLITGFSQSMGFVVVAVNNRAGAFGFLSIEELWQTNSSYGNFGIQDQLLSLEWVQKNIELFGGDKNSVTILGGTSTFALMGVRSIHNVNFHKAIALSASPNLNTTYIEASRRNKKFLNDSKCAHLQLKELVDCLYDLTTEEVQETFNWNFTSRWDFPEKGIFEAALPVIDPVVMKYSAADTSKITGLPKIPLIIGNTAQEIGLKPTVSFDDKTLNDYESYLSGKLQTFSLSASVVLSDCYGWMSKRNYTAEFIHETVASDVRAICPTNRLKNILNESPHYVVYRYVFDAAETDNDNDKITKGKSSSFNGLDLVSLLTISDNDKVGELLRKNLKHFIQFGHPSELGWDTTKTAVLNQNKTFTILNGDYHKEECSFWNSPANGFAPYAWKS